jgi:hypothetical protein
VRTHLTAKAGAQRIVELMGSDTDALKLVSCMTLFQHVARTLHAKDPEPLFAAMADHADAILAVAINQSYARCMYTERHLGGRST